MTTFASTFLPKRKNKHVGKTNEMLEKKERIPFEYRNGRSFGTHDQSFYFSTEIAYLRRQYEYVHRMGFQLNIYFHVRAAGGSE